MNAVTYSINFIKRFIPKQILHYAYLEKYGQVETIESIMEGVISRTCLVDSNIVAGITAYIRLNEDMVIERDEFDNKIINIPIDSIGDNKILSVYSIVQDRAIGNNDFLYKGDSSISNTIRGSSTRMMTNVDSTFYVDVTANLSIVGERTIHIMENISNLNSLILKVMIENQNLMNNLNTRAYMIFAKLALLAIKADIYNRTIIEMGSGKLEYGQELGIIKSKIEEYSDANEQYLEYFENKWRKTTYFTDDVKMNNLVTTLFPNNL